MKKAVEYLDRHARALEAVAKSHFPKLGKDSRSKMVAAATNDYQDTDVVKADANISRAKREAGSMYKDVKAAAVHKKLRAR